MAPGNLVRFGLAALAAAVVSASGPAGLAAPPQAHTQSGEVRGAIEDGVEAFRGVPFAAPPVGPLRWRPPQPPRPWTGVRDASAYGPDCIQMPMSSVPGPGFTNPQSEDCLYLNVWTPATRPARPMPVMVWIYGGAYIMGSGSYPDYDGAHFAQQGVVLVTFNYRVGLFGFFAHPALTREAAGGPVADYGFMDQIAALKWVRRNIAAFGGDPSNVTIFGESAGGFSVNAMLVSPAAKGLFAKAISESGGGRDSAGSHGWPTLARAEAQGVAWARSFGAASDDAAALRAVPAPAIYKASTQGALPSPIVDGVIAPEPIDQAMLAGRHAVVPYMVGANSQEESLLQWLPGALAAHQQALGPFRDEAMRLYEDGGRVDPDTAARRLWGDDFMVAPARFLARNMAASGAPTYLYHYAYVPVAMRGKAAGAPHSAEINLVFANEGRVSMFGEGPKDAPMADLMHAYWIAFARTGDPNGGGRPAWPAYSAAGDALMDFTDAGATVAPSFEKAKLDLLDRVYEAGRAGR